MCWGAEALGWGTVAAGWAPWRPGLTGGARAAPLPLLLPGPALFCPDLAHLTSYCSATPRLAHSHEAADEGGEAHIEAAEGNAERAVVQPAYGVGEPPPEEWLHAGKDRLGEDLCGVGGLELGLSACVGGMWACGVTGGMLGGVGVMGVACPFVWVKSLPAWLVTAGPSVS